MFCDVNGIRLCTTFGFDVRLLQASLNPNEPVVVIRDRALWRHSYQNIDLYHSPRYHKPVTQMFAYCPVSQNHSIHHLKLQQK